jgi:DNA-binding NarL/FixJ family response regulator
VIFVKVFVVEAQPLFGPEVARLVELAGGSVVGAAADLDLADILVCHADVVLIDLDFTGLDVIDAVDALRHEAAELRIIVLTCDRAPGWHARCLAAGASAVVGKTAGARETIAALRRVFDERETRTASPTLFGADDAVYLEGECGRDAKGPSTARYPSRVLPKHRGAHEVLHVFDRSR